ncbi:transcriptional regulator [Corynebacterium mustelae]|uniref:Transcriptional regulator n=1 Tax=Corynebacterium mustelae TaxID=571915 RepID=A0A0G3GYF8_9CORY|nr:MarR family winged helix-turn-helix transcriptional regulator [Corynebacterium mustelae]AKK05590.1 transcriptional regulator [Corynebacterium mustelae]
MTTPRWLTDDEQQFWRLMLAAIRKVEHHIENILQDGAGLTTSEFAVLVCLSESPDKEIRLRDLCADLDWDRSRTSHQVTRMEKRGLVTKQRCIGDARGIIIELTEEGERRIREAAPFHVESVREIVFDSLNNELKEPVAEFLQNILEQPVGRPRNE